MKKKYILIVLVFVLLTILLIALLLFNKVQEIGSFDVNNYMGYINEFPLDISLGYVENPSIAKEKAEQVWLEIFGEKVLRKKPYIVTYDSVNEIWLVEGTLPYNYIGGVPYALIRKSDGKVLAVWHTK